MKRFAVILIIAVLALGCVFATETGSTVNSKDTVSGGTNGDKFYVTTKIDSVYPAYQIIGYTGTDETSTGAVISDGSGSSSIVGTKSKSEDGTKEYLAVKVAIQHYGLENNDTTVTTTNNDGTKTTSVNNSKTNIRYKGTVTVTVTADALKNTTSTTAVDTANAVNSDNHVYKSDLPTTTAFTPKTGVDNLTVSAGTVSSNSTTVTATYVNGKAVATGNSAVTIANGCTFTWETTNLTAGDNYKAEVKVTYEAQ